MMRNKSQIFKLILFAFVLMGAQLQALSQTSKVSGVVKDRNTGEALVGVLVKGPSNSTTTDSAGTFTLQLKVGDKLIFTYMGYSTSELIYNKPTDLIVHLSSEVTGLNEIVVVGYGKQSRATLTTAISKLNPDVLVNVPFSQVATALQGTVPGVRVQTVNGQPGAAPRIILRGGTSINNPNGASPLYIVDGVIRLDMNDLNADDIESMEILKDAAATAIYGARGSNGVVLISTKAGKTGKTQLSYRYNLGFDELAKQYDFATAEDYINYNRLGILATSQKHPEHLTRLTNSTGYGTGNDLTNNTAYTTQYLTPANQHKLSEGWYSMPDPTDPSKTIIYKPTDWQDVLFRTSLTHNHYLSFSGGSEKSTFYGGVGYLTNNGIAKTTGYNRFNVDVNGDVKLSSGLKGYAKINFSNRDYREVYSTNQLFQRAIGLPPTTKYTFEDGSLAPGLNRTMGNPDYHLTRRDANFNLNRLSISGGLEWTIIPGLTFEPSASLYAVQGITAFFQKSYNNTPTQVVTTREANGSHSLYWQKQFDGILTYNKTYANKHNFQAKLGASYFDRKNYSLNAVGQGAVTDLVPTMNASSKPVSVSSEASHQVIAGYFGRVTYDYEQKYLFAANFRYDGASNLGNNHKWGMFPGVSLGWNAHREEFWNNMPKVFSSLKLRASYGVNGNISGLEDFHAQGKYDVSGTYNGRAVILSSRMENQDLQWERSKTIDFGTDMGLFNNRVTILFDYYRRVTDNLLTSLSLPQETGFPSILTNYGSLENRGVELDVTTALYKAKESRGFYWNVGVNAAFVKNKILKLPDNGNENNRVGGIYVYDPARGDYAWLGGLQEGQPLGNVYAYKQLSIYATDAEAQAGPVDDLVVGLDKTKYGGDVNWQDVDGNGIIDSRDQVYVGNIFPKWTGGIHTTLGYKDFTLTVRTDFSLGHTIYNESRARFLGQFQGDINTIKEVYQSWQKQGDVTNIPRYYWADNVAQNNLFRGNSYYYEKGDYLAIREVTLSYAVPKKWINHLKMSNLRIYATGGNLHYFTNYKGLLPEEGGTDSGRYPVSRSLIFGVNVNF